MDGDIVASTVVDQSDTDDFVTTLEGFAGGLTAADRAILLAALNAAIGPWQRIDRTPVDAFLTPEQARLVDAVRDQEVAGS